MNKTGIIISNHGAEPETEKLMKKQFGVNEVLYFKHPGIDPHSTKDEVWKQAEKYMEDIISSQLMTSNVEVAIVNGEYGFSTACVYYIWELMEVESYYPTSERGAKEEILDDGSIKTTHVYKFVQFRKW